MEKKSDLVIVSLKDFPQHVVGTKTEHDLYADHYPSDEELENERLKFKTPWQEARNKFVSLQQEATIEPKDLFDYLAAYAVYSFDATYFRCLSSADFVNGVSLDRESYAECVRAYEDCCEMRMTPRVRKMYDDLRQTANLRYRLASSTLEEFESFVVQATIPEEPKTANKSNGLKDRLRELAKWFNMKL